MYLPRVLPTTLCSILIAPAAAAQWSAEFKFDESSGTTASDISGNNNHGTLVNFSTTSSPWVGGKFGNALSFDGVDDYVDIGIKAALPVFDGKGTPYTVAFWVKAPAQHDRRVYSEGSTTSNRDIITIGTGRSNLSNMDKLQLYYRSRENRIVLETYTAATVFDDQWHHVAIVDISGDVSIYVDGVKDTNVHQYSTAPGAANFGTYLMNRASVGAVLRAGVCCFLQGLIDDLRVYHYASTLADIKLMMLNVPKLACRASIGYYGHGCNGTLDISATGTAVFGSTVNVQLTGGIAGANALLLVGAGVDPVDLSVAGFGGCVSYPSFLGSILAAIGKLDATGASVTVPVTMPTNPALACAIGSVQGVGISGAQLQLSRAAVLQLGN